MAEDIWTLKLQFEGDPPGQKMVQREMDKDEICFFNLIELIEEYGYTSVDYVYYKRRDGLVAIQWDSDVMQMLEENESKRKVSLFVTKQRMATIAPTKFNEEPTNSAENKNKGSSMMKIKVALSCMFEHPGKTNVQLSYLNVMPCHVMSCHMKIILHNICHPIAGMSI